MSSQQITRRQALRLVSMAAGGLLLSIEDVVMARATPAPGDPEVRALGYFIELHGDGRVDLVLTRHEMGQGVATALALLAAQELGADPARMGVRLPSTSEARYPLAATGGSTTLKNAWLPIRQGAALAREALVGAAARRWNVDIAACETRMGWVEGPGSLNGQRLPFQALLADVAAAVKLPADLASLQASAPPLRAPTVGSAGMAHIGSGDIVRGVRRYGLDQRVPGQLYASVERCPRLFGRVRRFDASEALKVRGVRQVLIVDALHDPMRNVPAPATFTSTKSGVRYWQIPAGSRRRAGRCCAWSGRCLQGRPMMTSHGRTWCASCWTRLR